MTTATELLNEVFRYLPNTITVSLIILGITLGKISWILIAVLGIGVAVSVMSLQYVLAMFGIGNLPGSSVMYTCTILPVSRDSGTFSAVPSLWITMTAFYMTYILTNAINIYTSKPSKIPKDVIPVQQRRGVGIMSMIATIVLFMFFLVPRFLSQCEGTVGAISGAVLGMISGWGAWNLLNACNSYVYPDIHGVMIGLKPGSLHTSPRACTPRSTD